MTSDKRSSSVSYNKSQPINDDHPSDVVDDENEEFDPQIQTYLAKVSQQSGCWGKRFPIPFERAARRSWWDPTFDSEILEEQYKTSASTHNRYKFRCVTV